VGQLFNKIIYKTYHSALSGFFHTSVNQLQKDLSGCKTVLDLGCGPSSPLEYIKNIDHSVGVEAYEPYLERSKKKGIHTEYVKSMIEDLDYKSNCFDAVIIIGVIEHLKEETGHKLIKLAEKWAKKKVIITTPNGFIAQKSLDGNKLQIHLSGWKYTDMKKLGYKVHGMAGLKWLRQETDSDGMGDDLLVTMRWHPKIFWFFVSTFSQIFTYHFPKYCFDMYCIKEKK
jgi:hypothetical protein